MESKNRFIGLGMMLVAMVMVFPCLANARPFQLNARSAILIDMTNGRILFEQNADRPIAPASITKILTLYLVFEALQEGQIHLWDTVNVSNRAACTPPSRMGLRTGQNVTIEELIKGMAVVSGNDACVAMAEHLGGSVENFVRRMNYKARELGLENSWFGTPNGLPAKDQLTTARDLARLSIAYLRRFPESLYIHSLRSYTYNNVTRHNANRLLGTCPGVDGLKTGFVCASGYNLSATAKRGDVRLLAVVLGAPNAGIRAVETEKLLEYGFAQTGAPPGLQLVEYAPLKNAPSQGRVELGEEENCEPGGAAVRGSRIVRSIRTVALRQGDRTALGAAAPAVVSKKKSSVKQNTKTSVRTASKTSKVKQAQSAAGRKGKEKITTARSKSTVGSKKSRALNDLDKAYSVSQQKQPPAPLTKKAGTTQKLPPQVMNTKDRRG